MHFLQNYMTPVQSRDYHGYRALPKYTSGSFNIHPSNPSRPADYNLSVCYTHEMVPGFRQAFLAASRLNQFPGVHTPSN